MDEEKKEKSILEWKSNPLLLAVVGAILTASIATLGYFGRNYFDSSSKKAEKISQYKEDVSKQYYEKSKPVIKKLNESKDKLFILLERKYGFSTFDLEKPLSDFRNAISSYNEYVSELELYGNSDQVASAKEIQNWLNNIFGDFSYQYNSAKKVQDSIEEMLARDDKKIPLKDRKNYYKFHQNEIINDIDELIKKENDLYYKCREYSYPIFDILYNQLIYNFRISIGLGMTNEIANSYKNSKNIDKFERDSRHKDSPIEYVVAEQRAFLSNDFSVGGKDQFFIQKNSLLRFNLIAKLEYQVIENNPFLKKKMEEIMKEESKAK
jgi:hypothetical protein